MPGLPAAAPIAAPAAAPIRVPIAAPLTTLWVEACEGEAPVCWDAHCRQDASSPWNCSNALPRPGSTVTLGPAGTVAQPEIRTAATSGMATTLFIIPLVHSAYGRGGTLIHASEQRGTVG